MNLTKLFKMACFGGIGLSFFSCDNSNSYVDTPEVVPVRSLEVQASYDLSSRSDWKFYVHGYTYPFSVEGSKLMATPVSEKETYFFSITSTNNQGRAMIKFMPENYLKTKAYLPGSSGGSTIVANLEKQGTLEDFIACDILYYEYTGTAKENLYISPLHHENALLHFAIVDLPEDAKVYIKQIHDQKIIPLKQSENEYQAIIFPENIPATICVVVEANGKTYTNDLLSTMTTRKVSHTGIGHGVVIKFTVEIVNERLVTKILSAKFSSSEWPITQ